ncbi:MAG: hypothetical protein ACLTWK_00160 [Eisenbergiella sp.]
MKLFECIIDGEEGVFKTFLTAKNKKELTENYVDGGRFEKITDVTDEYLIPESVDLLRDHLSRMGWGKAETKIICSLVAEHIRERDEKIRKDCRKTGSKRKKEKVIRKSNYEKYARYIEKSS